jgi:hypothetical protein
MGEKNGRLISVRLSEDEGATLSKAISRVAEEINVPISLSAYVRQAVMDRARSDLRKRKVKR